MAYEAKKYTEELSKIKKDIEDSYLYSRGNYERYHYFRRFLYKSTLSNSEISILNDLKRPTLEFNVVEAYVSRLVGEFSQQEPSIAVRGANIIGGVDSKTVQLVEGILRAIFDDAKNNHLQYEAISRLLSGGFNVMKVYTEYASEGVSSSAFDQVIKVRNSFDPTMCGFDPLSRESHKADGNYCFELFPKTYDEFVREYGSDAVDGMKFSRDLEGFSWSYTGGEKKIILVGDYYKKKRKEAKIVQLVTGQVMTTDEYDQLVGKFQETGIIAQPPGVVGKSRKTHITTICHYHMVENKVLNYEETDYKYLPLVYMAGSAPVIRDSTGGSAEQVTRPYIYNAEGMQRLINFAGQQLANELENILQQKWVVAKEALAEGYLDCFTNPQVASTIVFNAFKTDGTALPPPREVNRMPAPPEAAATFSGGPQLLQTIIGSYDASLGINKNQLSGVAIVNGATQSNATAMPFIVGLIQGLNQIANIIVDLIPKYYTTPRTVPIVGMDGKRSDALINHPQGQQINYAPNDLQVTVSAGVSFAIQQQQALEAMLGLAKESPTFAAFINQEGLEILLDNIDIRGIDQLKMAATKYMQQVKQQQQSQPNPDMIKLQLMMQQFQESVKQNQATNQLQAGALEISKQNADTTRMKALAEIGEAVDEMELKKDKVQSENARTAVDLAVRTADMHHGHAKDKAEFMHKVHDAARQHVERTSQNRQMSR